jgi:hypothetical protein
MSRVFTTQIGFVTIAEATPAVIAEAMCIWYSGRAVISLILVTKGIEVKGGKIRHACLKSKGRQCPKTQTKNRFLSSLKKPTVTKGF